LATTDERLSTVHGGYSGVHEETKLSTAPCFVDRKMCTANKLVVAYYEATLWRYINQFNLFKKKQKN